MEMNIVAIYKMKDWGCTMDISDISLIISRSVIHNYVALCKWAWCVDTLYVCITLDKL